LRVGDLLQKLGRTGEAVAQYKQLTRHYAKEGFLIQAISLNKIILRIDPSQEGINKELANLYAQTGVSSKMVAKGQRVEKELPEIPLFSELNRDELHEVVSRLTAKRVARGSFLCKEGDPGDSIYIISSGKVGVLKYSKKKHGDILLATLNEGDFFGESGFFSDRKRHATVKALTELEILEISRNDFDEIAKVHPRIRDILLNFYKKRIIDTLLAFSPLFRQLQPHERAQLVSRFKLRRIGENRLIFKEGAPPRRRPTHILFRHQKWGGRSLCREKGRAQGYLGLSQGRRFLRGNFVDLQPTSNGQRQDHEDNGTAGVGEGGFRSCRGSISLH
jgi:cAMP-dependent protein kinase regulator